MAVMLPRSESHAQAFLGRSQRISHWMAGVYFVVAVTTGGFGIVELYQGIRNLNDDPLNLATPAGALGIAVGTFLLRYAMVLKRA